MKKSFNAIDPSYLPERPGLFMLLSFLLFPLFSNAQSSITVYDEEGAPFRLWMNGKAVDTGNASSRVRIDSIEAGKHLLEVRYPESSLSVPEKQIRIGRSVTRTYSLQRDAGGERQWNLISEIRRTVSPKEGREAAKAPEVPAADSSFIRSYKGESACPDPIGRARMKGLLEALNEKIFERERYELARRKLEANCLTSSQVAALMRTLSYEEHRLDLAKYAYERTFDQKNYGEVRSALNFEMSRRKLDRFLGKVSP